MVIMKKKEEEIRDARLPFMSPDKISFYNLLISLVIIKLTEQKPTVLLSHLWNS